MTSGQEGAEGHAPNPAEIRVFSVGKSLKIEPFKIPENPLEIGRAWKEWIEDFEDETYFEITRIKDRVSALKIYGGKEIQKLARNLPHTTPVVGDDDYKKLKRKLDNHFLPKKKTHQGRFTFSKQRPIEGESIVTYAARLREKSKDCEFGEQTDDRILVHLIQTIKDNELVKRSIQKKWNLDKIPIGSKSKRRHQSASERHKRRSQDIESRTSIKRFSEERQVVRKKKLEETAATAQKTRTQERRERERQKLWLLWKDRSTPSRPKLPSIQTGVLKVWQIQSFCVM